MMHQDTEGRNRLVYPAFLIRRHRSHHYTKCRRSSKRRLFKKERRSMKQVRRLSLPAVGHAKIIINSAVESMQGLYTQLHSHGGKSFTSQCRQNRAGSNCPGRLRLEINSASRFRRGSGRCHSKRYSPVRPQHLIVAPHQLFFLITNQMNDENSPPHTAEPSVSIIDNVISELWRVFRREKTLTKHRNGIPRRIMMTSYAHFSKDGRKFFISRDPAPARQQHPSKPASRN